MSTEQEYRAQVTRTAEVVRERHRSATDDAVLSGAFDRFISALARMMAFDLHAEYGNDSRVDLASLDYWHGDGRQMITRDKFEAMCSAHGIPQEILIIHAVSGADYFQKIYGSHLGSLFGWKVG